MKTLTKYNIFIFLTTFAKSLVEVFIPMILLNNGYGIREILLFFMISFGINIVLSPIINCLGNKISYKWIVLLSAFIFSLMYYFLVDFSNIYLIIFLYSLNTTMYYLGKHNYAASSLEQKSIGSGVGSVLIFTILALIPASFVGSFLIKKLSVLTTILIITIIYLTGVIPLFFINHVNHKHDKVLKMIKKIPRKNYLFFSLSQMKVLFFLFYPLYIYLNIKKDYSYIGIVNAIVGISSIIFIYFYAKKMDKDKKDFMLFASILLSVILMLEINIKNSIFILIASFFEGIATKLYETSTARDFYLLGNDYDKSCYFLVSELLNNIVKLAILLLFYIININLYWLLIILIAGIFANSLVKFKYPGKEKVKASNY